MAVWLRLWRRSNGKSDRKRRRDCVRSGARGFALLHGPLKTWRRGDRGTGGGSEISAASGFDGRCYIEGIGTPGTAALGVILGVSGGLGRRDHLEREVSSRCWTGWVCVRLWVWVWGGVRKQSTPCKERRPGAARGGGAAVVQGLSREGLLEGENLGVDATTLEASAARRSIVRRDNGRSYEEHVVELMKKEEGWAPAAARWRWDRKRKKQVSNGE